MGRSPDRPDLARIFPIGLVYRNYGLPFGSTHASERFSTVGIHEPLVFFVLLAGDGRGTVFAHLFRHTMSEFGGDNESVYLSYSRPNLHGFVHFSGRRP